MSKPAKVVSEKAMEAATKFNDTLRENVQLGQRSLILMAAALEEYAREVAVEAFLECADVAGGNESDEYYRKHAEEWWEGRKNG